MWTHPAGSYDTAPNKRVWPFSDYRLPGTSRMTPTEGALYLGVPNVIFLRYSGRPLPSGFGHYARRLTPFKRIVWQVNISPGRKGPVQMSWTDLDEEEHAEIRRLFWQHRNFVGVILDDYFKNPSKLIKASGPAAVRKVKASFPRAEFWDRVYTVNIESTNKEHLALMDVVSIWTRKYDDLVDLERNLTKLETLYPQMRKVLGVFMWEYLGDKRPIPLDRMKHECEVGLRWLKAGRIEGMAFCGSPMCDMGVEAVEWVRRWIRQVGDEPVPRMKTSRA
jgi:hypothetical protein